MKNILVIKTSLRYNSNSDILADKFVEGAILNNNVEVISLKDKKINFCIGCMSCAKNKKCFMNDDANMITDEIAKADVIVWSTPIYYYSMSGQMKTLIDRANSLYVRGPKFKEVYLLVTAADTEKYTPDGAKKGVQGWVDCFDGVKFVDTLFIGGVNDPKDILNSSELNKAYELGKSIK